MPTFLRSFLAVVAVAIFALPACGGSDDDPADAPAAATPSASAPKELPILIETDVKLRVKDPRYNSKKGVVQGTVEDGSTLGDSPFCVGGTVRDRHGSDAIGGLVDRAFECPEGTMRVVFTPGVPQGLTQSGHWRALGGTGAFEGVVASGEMKIVYDGKKSDAGRETFTGTLTLAVT